MGFPASAERLPGRMAPPGAMGGFVLFGHSFVKRFKNKRGPVYEVELSRGTVPLTCLGEGGLSMDRIYKNPVKYLDRLRRMQPSVLIIDLGTNDICSEKTTPHEVHASVCRMVRELPRWDVHAEAVIFLPVLPRTGGLRRSQVSLEVFNERAKVFNELLECSTFVEDRWWVWRHRGLKHKRYNLDGVHLTQLGMLQYERTLRQLLKFFESRIW